MHDEIMTHTNAKLERMRIKLKKQDGLTYKNLEKDELNALFAIILLCFIFKSSRESLKSLFSTTITGRPIFRAIMTEKRCYVLLRALRFDDSSTRLARLEEDKACLLYTSV